MTALTADRKTDIRDGEVLTLQVAAAAVIYAGALVAVNATGFLAPAVAGAGIVMGKADGYVDNTSGADGDVSLEVRTGLLKYINDGTITVADIGADAYVVDDQTVAAAGTVVAGAIKSVDSDGVFIQVV